MATEQILAPPTLPRLLTRMIDRQDLCEELSHTLRRDDVRLLTLTGPGGVGKTRLAIALAEQMSAYFADGVYFVSLADLLDQNFVIPTVAQTLGCKGEGQAALNNLRKLLADKNLLIVLDNLEHLPGAIVPFISLFAYCPQIKVLTTSRVRLRIEEEYERAVPPLDLPDLSQPVASKEILQYSSIQLFVDRARTQIQHFTLTDNNAHEVAQICAYFDGLPLALELVVARLKILSLTELLKRLNEHLSARLDYLTRGFADMPARQQTLRRALQWSYNLLSPVEQQCFRRLGVFAGGFTLEALEALITELGEDPGQIRRAVASLCDSSLLCQDYAEGTFRFYLLETIRAMAWDLMQIEGEAEAVRMAHAHFYLSLAEEAAPHLFGKAEQDEWLLRLEQELDNLRAAFRWASDHDAERWLKAAAGLYRFWGYHHHRSEVYSQAITLLEQNKDIAPQVRADALDWVGTMALHFDEYDRAEKYAQESVQIFEQLGNKRGIADALFTLGALLLEKGLLNQAAPIFTRCYDLSVEVDYHDGKVFTLLRLMRIALCQGDVHLAQQYGNDALAFARKEGSRNTIIICLTHAARPYFEQGFYAQTCAIVDDALDLLSTLVLAPSHHLFVMCSWLAFAQKNDIQEFEKWLRRALENDADNNTQSIAYSNLALLALIQNKPEKVFFYLEKSKKAAESAKDNEYLFGAYLGLARQALAAGNIQQVRVYLAACQDFVTAEIDHRNELIYYDVLGAYYAAKGQVSLAVELWGSVTTLRDSLGLVTQPFHLYLHKQQLALARTHLSKQAFSMSWTKGTKLQPLTFAQLNSIYNLPAQSTQPSLPAEKPAQSARPDHQLGLTAREMDVLRCIADGLTNSQIAERLILAPSTVSSYQRTLYKKLKVSSRSTALLKALDLHLLT